MSFIPCHTRLRHFSAMPWQLELTAGTGQLPKEACQLPSMNLYIMPACTCMQEDEADVMEKLAIWGKWELRSKGGLSCHACYITG